MKRPLPVGQRQRRALDTALAWSPLQAVFHWRASGRLAVLGYHGVDDPDSFAAHLDHLVRRARPVSLDDVLDAVDGRRRLPRRAVLITFDDGERSVLEVGVPLLRERGVPAVVFVVAGLIDGNQSQWWEEIEFLVAAGGETIGLAGRSDAAIVRHCKAVADEERLAVLEELRSTASRPAPAVGQLRRSELVRMESEGVVIGNHSLTHPILTSCSDDKIRTEVAESHRVLTEVLGHPPAAFAYPNGNCDQRVRAAVAACGYRLGFVFDHRLSKVPPPDPLRTSRLRVDSDTSTDRFRAILSGLHPALHHLRTRAAAS